jgi:lipopolysaccharide export system protein LptA
MLFLCCRAVTAQSKVVIVEHADSLVGKMIDGEEARELVGNVRFTQDQVQVWCDRATQFIRVGILHLTGNVVVQDDSVTMRAPRGLYDQSQRRAEAFDGVLLEDGKVTLTAREGEYFVGPKRAHFRKSVVVTDPSSTVMCDSLIYYRLEKRSLATGNVSVIDRVQKLSIHGTRLEHWSDRQYSKMTGNPELNQVDTSMAGVVDTLVVRSLEMESQRGEHRRMLARDSVRIVRGNLLAVADVAFFFPDGDSILLREDPVVWYEKSQVSGDSINVYMEEKQLHRVHVVGQVFAVTRNDSATFVRFDQLAGDSMAMHFEDRQLQRIEVNQRAMSLYHLYEGTAANGLNKTSGDNIIIEFDGGKASSITAVGGVEGQYVPENLLQGNEASFHLPGFLWRQDRPRLHAGELRSIRGKLSQTHD